MYINKTKNQDKTLKSQILKAKEKLTYKFEKKQQILKNFKHITLQRL